MLKTFQSLFRLDSRIGKVFEVFIQLLILTSLVTFSLDTLPNLSPEIRELSVRIEIFTVIVFTLEYVGRILFSTKRLGYITSFYGVVDLLAILPFYLSLGVDLRSLRALRFFRLFRLFKLARYNTAMQRFGRAFQLAREEILLFSLLTLILLYLSAVGIYYFEHEAQPAQFSSIFHSFWWAVSTLTTVGYGDVYPITVGGRVFTFFILLIGLGIVAVPGGILASSLSKVRQEEMV